MSILKVAQLGNPALRIDARHVKKGEIKDPFLQKLIDDMIETMEDYSGVGLAAPQIHESKKIIVLESMANERYPDSPDIPLTVLINPDITHYSVETSTSMEGCLSLGSLRGSVERSTSIRVEGLDRKGHKVELNAEGFLAVVLQHEVDHLNSTLFIDRMGNMESLGFLKEYERCHGQ